MKSLCFAITVLLISQFGSADIMHVKNDLFNDLNSGTQTINYDQLMSSDTVLLFAFTADDFNLAGPALSITYDPGGLNEATTTTFLSQADQSAARVRILGLELGNVLAAPVEISVTSPSDDSAISIIQITGATLTGFTETTDTATNGAVSTTPDFTGLDAGSFILSAVSARNGSGSWTAVGPPTFDNQRDAGRWTEGLSYQTNTTGTILSWTHSDTTDNHALAAVAIAPIGDDFVIPEPASAGMLGIGVMALIHRRRRAC